MVLTAGTISLVSKSQSQVKLITTAASGGVGPYTQQWYKSTTSGFSPGGGNIISGATALSLTDTAVVPNTTYYYKVVFTDTGDSNTTVTATQLSVATDVPSQQPNQFAETPQLGMLDLRFNPDSVSAQIDSSESGTLRAGAAVKIVDSAGGVPKVVACTASTDQVFGFINYDIKSAAFVAGDMVELSQDLNVMWLYATGAIARGAQVTLDITSPGAVASAAAPNRIVGFAYDKAAGAGSLIRVKLNVPSFAVAS